MQKSILKDGEGGAKQHALKWYKDRAWKAFSSYIRTRDCLRTTMRTDAGTCCTCNRLFPYKRLQAGHFIDGRNNAVLFSEQGVHAQCEECNLKPPYGKGGNPMMYWQFMLDYYGREVIDRLIKESATTVKYSKIDYEAVEKKYKRKLEELLADPSLAKLNTPIKDF